MNRMILAAHQPQYLPWLGYFDKMDRVDIFVLLDTVQFKKNEWQNRNRIKGSSGPHWLTVPVRRHFPQRLHQVEIVDPAFRRRHRRSLQSAYGKAPYFRQEAGILDDLYGRDWTDLSSLNVESVRSLAGRFGIETPVHLGSEFQDVPDDQADDRLIALCRRLGADTYMAGAGGQAYMDLSRWQRAGIGVVFQEFRHPVYPQRNGTFVPSLSAVDLLFHCGSEGFVLVRRARKEAA